MFGTIMGLPWRDKRDFGMIKGLFEGESGTGGGGGGTGGAGAGTGGTGGGTGGAGSGGTSDAVTFENQGALQARLDRHAESTLAAQAKDLGFESVEAMKAAAKKAKEADDKAKSDLEKANEGKTAAETKAQTERSRADKIAADAEVKILSQALKDNKKFIDANDAVAMIDRTNIKVDDQGNVTGVAEALETLAKAKPHLLGLQARSGGMPGSAGNGGRQDGGTGGQGGIGESLAKKNSEAAKNTSGAQKNYFGDQ
ncbi:MAG: hypothetical protein WA118_08270 [Carboxydocellales bacterium]